MESILAIGVGLVLRIVVDIATHNDDRVGGVLVGLWEGVVLNHFVRRMPRSFDPYLGFGFRIFVDFLFTQSLSRLALVALWALVGMLLADITPNVWRESGLRHLYRQVRKDVRHVKRAVPRIRIKNDLPSVRLFSRSRSTSTEVSGSIRSDRAAPSRSLAPSPAPTPTPGPARRAGRSPPGSFPDVSGWSETDTDVSHLRERIITNPGPSPALIPSREHAAYGRADTTHVSTPQTRTTTVQDTTITITQTQNESVLLETVVDAVRHHATAASTSLEPIDDPSRHDPPTIPDDWVDVIRPAAARSNEPVAPFQPDPDSTPESQPGPPTLTPSRPASILDPPPAIDVLPDIPDVDLGKRASRAPDRIPLPESRAASVIGGVYDQPRSALRDSLRSGVGKASSEIGVGPAKSFVPPVATQSTKNQSTSGGWTGFSWARSRHENPVDADAPGTPVKETQGESVDEGKPDVGGVVQGFEPQIPTPAQVDPPANILTQPEDTPPPLFIPGKPEPKPEQQQEQPQANKPDQIPTDDAGVDSSPSPLQGGADKGDTAGPSKTSLFDSPSPTRTPPPPFSEFAGVPEGPAAGEAPVEQDPVTQDEALTQLTEEQKAVEEKRLAFLLTRVQELEESRADLQRKLDKMGDPKSRPAKTIESDLENMEKTLNAVKARMTKTKFFKPPPNTSIPEVALLNKSAPEAHSTLTSAVLDVLLARDDVEPMTIQAVIGKQKPANRKARDALNAFAKR
ncbi:hypothetical protein J3R83DRAFT_3637 [Lanmaoa asiatica]|nr:hypothetical protein J3R83DRAFT_3637 [Lanmaoa asiatica]